MRGYNVLLIFHADGDKILMCKRRKEPFKGLLNLTGGKIEPGEDGLAAAYREMWEETGITSQDITLFHLMDFTYYYSDCLIEVYAGKLKREVLADGDENELCWIDSDSDFFDCSRFAGYGNIGHIVKEAMASSAKRFID